MPLTPRCVEPLQANRKRAAPADQTRKKAAVAKLESPHDTGERPPVSTLTRRHAIRPTAHAWMRAGSYACVGSVRGTSREIH
jgi:hypothetical protein